MSTHGPTVSAEGENNVGGETGALSGRLRDVAPSCSDPREDLVLPDLGTPAWHVLLDGKVKAADVQSVLKAVIAWRAAGRLRRAYGLPLWTGEDPADFVTVPTSFPVARQSGAGEAEIRHRINNLERWALDLAAQNLDLTRQVLQASDLPQRKDSRLAVLRHAVALEEPERRHVGRKNELAVPRDLLAGEPLENGWAETKRLIEASARWGLHLARLFQDRFTSLTRDFKVSLGQPWWKPEDQGRTAGCVGWAVAGLLRNQLNDDRLAPSARYLWQGAKELDGESRPTTFVARAGTSLRGALHLVRQVGCAVESELPSDSVELYDGSLEEFYRQVSRRRIAAVVNLGTDKKMWLAWLALGRPIACTIRMTGEFAEHGPDSPPVASFPADDGGLGNHVVVVAGWRLAPDTFSDARPSYDLVDGAVRADRKPAGDQTRYFPVEYLVRNSAGERWGNRGDAWVAHPAMRLMAREAFGVLLTDDEVAEPGAPPEKRSWASRA